MLAIWHTLTRLASKLKHISEFKEVAHALVAPLIITDIWVLTITVTLPALFPLEHGKFNSF